MLLVTGGAGFIGSNVVASLNEAGRPDIAVSDSLGSDGKWRNLGSRQLADFVPPGELMRWLRTARLMRLSLEVNGGICRSLLRIRHGVDIEDPEEVVLG